jgi:hypothetical protein
MRNEKTFRNKKWQVVTHAFYVRNNQNGEAFIVKHTL